MKQQMYVNMTDATFTHIVQLLNQCSNEFYTCDTRLGEAIAYIGTLIDENERGDIIAIADFIQNIKKRNLEAKKATPEVIGDQT